MARATRVLSTSAADPTQTIVVCGTPRSGTTWIAAAAATLPGAGVLFEPLHPGRVPAVRRAGVGWLRYVRAGDAWPEGEQLMARVLRGEVLNAWTASELRRPRRVSRWVVKCVRANRLLPWLAARFPLPAPVLALRHPCAVVASQLPWPPPVDRPGGELLEDFPVVAGVLSSIRTPEEHRALRWAVDTLVPLSVPAPQPWLTLPYELLARQPERFALAFARWGEPVPAGLADVLPRPSSTRRQGGGDPVTDWTRVLSRAQVDRILAVVRAVGIEVYGDDPMPDTAALSRLTGASL